MPIPTWLPAPRGIRFGGIAMGVGLSGVLAGPGGAVTIRDNQTYPGQDAALLTNAGAPLAGLAGNFVRIGVGSGVYLGDGWVLSAAHFTPGNGGRANVTLPSGQIIGADVFRNPGWTGSFNAGGDFALLELDVTPIGLPTIDLFSGRSSELNGQTVTFFGYGDTGNGTSGTSLTSSSDGTLHAGQNVVNQIGGNLPGNTSGTFSSQVVFFDFDRPSSASDNPLGTAVPLTYEAMVADGDSGGGVFISSNGTTRLVGVNSLLFGINERPPASYGSVAGVSTLDGELPWIAQVTGNAIVQLGDANLNGTVEQGDLDAVLNNWGNVNRAWNAGDFTGDGTVDQGDLDAVLNNWGAGNAPSFVGFSALPEPGSLAVLTAIGVGIGLRRRSTTR